MRQEAFPAVSRISRRANELADKPAHEVQHSRKQFDAETRLLIAEFGGAARLQGAAKEAEDETLHDRTRSDIKSQKKADADAGMHKRRHRRRRSQCNLNTLPDCSLTSSLT